MATKYDISDFPQILLIDTNSPNVSSVGLVSPRNTLTLTEECRAQELLVLVETILRQSKTELRTIKAIGVIQRDGSLTGQRIGTAVANTLAWIIGAPLFVDNGDIESLTSELKEGKKFEIQKVVHTN